MIIVILFAALGHFCIDFMIGIWPVFKTIASLDLAVASLMAAFCVFVGESMQVFFGTLSDRGYARPLLIFAVLCASSSLFFPYFSHFTAFLLLYLGTCIGSSAFHPTAVGLLGSLDVPRKSSVMGIFTASGMLGLGVSQITFTWAYFDGSVPLLVIPPLLLALACFFFLPRQVPSLVPKEKFSFKLIGRFLKQRTLQSLFATLASNQIILFSFLFLLPDLLRSYGMPDWISLGGGMLVLMAGATISPPLIGYLADKFSIRTVLLSISALGSILFYTLLMLPGHSPELVLGLLFSLGIVLGGVSALVWSFGAQSFPEHRGMVSAFLMGFVWMIAEAGGIGLSGVLADVFNEDGPRRALLLIGSMSLIAIAFSSRLPKTVEVQAIP